jgi:hypothetical protein
MANPSTLVNIRDLIKAKADIKGDPNFTNVLLNREINDAQRNIQLRLFHLGYTEFRGSDTLTLSSATLADQSLKTAPMSTDCSNRMAVPNWLIYIDCSVSGGGITDSGLAYPVSEKVFLEHLRNGFLTPTNYEPKCMILNDLIYIAPSTIDTAIAHYYKEATDMASDSDTVDIPETFVKFIVLLVLLQIDDTKGRLADKQAALAELNNDIQKAFEAFKIQEVEEIKAELA